MGQYKLMLCTAVLISLAFYLFYSPSSLIWRGLFWQWLLSDSPALYQEQAVCGKMKMDPAKRAQTQNAGEILSLQWFFSQSVELMTDKDCLHSIRPILLK